MYKEISDDLWQRIEPLLEPFKRKRSGGKIPIPFRTILNGIIGTIQAKSQFLTQGK